MNDISFLGLALLVASVGVPISCALSASSETAGGHVAAGLGLGARGC